MAKGPKGAIKMLLQDLLAENDKNWLQGLKKIVERKEFVASCPLKKCPVCGRFFRHDHEYCSKECEGLMKTYQRKGV
jgi:hypothetical protein